MAIVKTSVDAIISLATEHYVRHTTLVTLFCQDVVQASFLAVIDGIEAEFTAEGLTDVDTDTMSPAEWDAYVTAIIVQGELIEAVEAESGSFITMARLIVDNPMDVRCHYTNGIMTVSSGEVYALRLQRLREPMLRSATRVQQEAADDPGSLGPLEADTDFTFE